MRTNIPLEEAMAVALKIVDLLRPHCQRIEIAGSIRRKQPFVNDIEIVAIPKPYSTGLFEDGLASVVNENFPKIKGELIYGKCKYTQRIVRDHQIKLDLFLAEEGNWGMIYAIRTGSADYSHQVLATEWVKRGYKSENGYLHRDGKTFFILEEKDLFERLQLPFVEPELRNINN